MRLLWILLSIFVQGSLARLFKAQPQALSVVHQGDAVLLECVTNEPVTCGWKLETLGLGATGFLNNMVPGNLDISARDKNSDMDCTITLNNVDNRFNGVYTCSPYTKNGGQANSDAAEVVIAQKPSRLEFLGAAAGSFELTASADQPTSVTCEASGARPKAKLEWYLENTQIYEGVVVTDTKDPATGLVTTNSTLTHRFRKENNGDQLRCVASHAGYDDQDSREQAIVVDVQYAPYRPEGNNVGKIYGFTAGEEGQVTLSFTANPMPGPMSWKIGDNVFVQTGSQSLDGRFTAGSLVTIDGQRGKYNLTLTIAPVRMEDQSKTFQLRLENEMGPTALEFTIGTGPAPPPQVMSSSAIVGAVVGGLVLLLIIGLVAFGRSRGKWCFAADSAECRSDRSDTESAHDEKTYKPEKQPFKFPNFSSSLLKSSKTGTDVEMAENKDETRGLTKAEGEPDGNQPEKKEGETVYAELLLNSDGVKTEVRPSAEKTEYAVIVGTKNAADGVDATDKARE